MFLSLQRRVGWRDEDTQFVTTQLSLVSVTCSCCTRKLQTASLKLPLPFASLQAWSRTGHTHLTVLPFLQWELGSAIIKIWGNPIITKAYGPHWAGCEKSTTSLTRQAMGNIRGQNYKGNRGEAKQKKSTTEGKNKFCQSLGMTSRKNALVRIMVGGCWDIPKGSSKTLSGMSLVLTTQPICLYSDEYLQLHTHQPRMACFGLHLYSKGPRWRTDAAPLMANQKWLNGTLASITSGCYHSHSSLQSKLHIWCCYNSWQIKKETKNKTTLFPHNISIWMQSQMNTKFPILL